MFGIAESRALGEEGPAVAFTAVRRVVPALGSGDGRGGEGWGRLRVGILTNVFSFIASTLDVVQVVVSEYIL